MIQTLGNTTIFPHYCPDGQEGRAELNHQLDGSSLKEGSIGGAILVDSGIYFDSVLNVEYQILLDTFDTSLAFVH